MTIDYLRKFARLHTAKSNTHWSASTRHRAPNKPLLLLAVLDQFAEGSITVNLIEPSDDLIDLYAIYMAKVMPSGRRGNFAMPFFHLRYDGFWHLLPRPGQETALGAMTTMTSLGQVRANLLGAQLDDALFEALADAAYRDALRTVLIETYFAPDSQPKLQAQGLINQEAYRYSEELLQHAAEAMKIAESPLDAVPAEAVRDQGFRRAVARVYDHRCAFCGIRMLTADGHTAIEAAHIVPWHVNHDDRVNNGMALCRLCHWAFDEGMLSVSSRYQILTSPQLTTDPNRPGHLSTLNDRPILAPPEERHWPDLHSLAWHRKHALRRR